MPHISHIYGRLSENTMEMAKIYLALCDVQESGERIETIHQELEEAKFDLFNSLKSNEGLAYVYLRHPHEFSELCVNVVEAMREHSRIQGNPFTSTHHFTNGNFAVEPDYKEEKLLRYLYDKKAALDRLEDSLLTSIQQTQPVLTSDNDPVRFLTAAISGFLARQMVAPSQTGNKIFDEKAERKALDDFRARLRPLVRAALDELSSENITVAECVRDKIMSEVACTDFFLTNLQQKPATSFIPTNAVG